MISKEERALLYLKALGGEADAEDLLRAMGGGGASDRQRLGHIMRRLAQRGIIGRRKVKTAKCRTIYKLKSCDPSLK